MAKSRRSGFLRKPAWDTRGFEAPGTRHAAVRHGAQTKIKRIDIKHEKLPNDGICFAYQCSQPTSCKQRLHRHGNKREASSLIQAKDHIRALDGLTCGALAQVVDCRGHHKHARGLIKGKTDLAGVAAGNRGCLGHLAGIEHAHEGTALVKLAIALNYHIKRQLLRRNLGKRNIDGREQTALEGCQMRREDNLVRQTENLFDFGRVTMLAYTVGLDALVGAAVMCAGVGPICRRPSHQR